MPPLPHRCPRTFPGDGWTAAGLARAKDGRRVSVVLPARDEEATVGAIVAAVRSGLVERHGLIDELVVVDDGSTDATAAVARRAGATVVGSGGAGKGDAMQAGLAVTDGDLVVYCDADVRSFGPQYVVGLLGPLVDDESVAFVKATYRRPLDGREDEGGRVTELAAKPLLRVLAPALAGFAQPLAGECAGRRDVLERVPFVRGYGVDIGLLLDVAALAGRAALAQVDLGERVHRNRPLSELGAQAETVLRTVLARTGHGDPVAQLPPLASRGRKTA